MVPTTRVTPVAFPTPYVMIDQVIIHYSPELALEIVPTRKRFPLGMDGAYDGTVVASPNTVTSRRVFVLAKADYSPADYAPLHEFFAAVAEADQEPFVFARRAVATIP